MLTGKAKEDFERWLSKESEKYHQHEWLDNDMYLDEIWLPPPIENSLIVEFFDSVGIYIEVGYLPDYKEYWRKVVTTNGTDYIRGYSDRQSATKAAIEQANLIYNEK